MMQVHVICVGVALHDASTRDVGVALHDAGTRDVGVALHYAGTRDMCGCGFA